MAHYRSKILVYIHSYCIDTRIHASTVNTIKTTTTTTLYFHILSGSTGVKEVGQSRSWVDTVTTKRIAQSYTVRFVASPTN